MTHDEAAWRTARDYCNSIVEAHRKVMAARFGKPTPDPSSRRSRLRIALRRFWAASLGMTVREWDRFVEQHIIADDPYDLPQQSLVHWYRGR